MDFFSQKNPGKFQEKIKKFCFFFLQKSEFSGRYFLGTVRTLKKFYPCRGRKKFCEGFRNKLRKFWVFGSNQEPRSSSWECPTAGKLQKYSIFRVEKLKFGSCGSCRLYLSVKEGSALDLHLPELQFAKK